MSLVRERIGPLDTISARGESAFTIVLFHGFGANAYDLAALHSEIPSAPGTGWVFPEGILGLGGPARAWWMVDQAAVQLAMATGQPRDLTGPPPPGLQAAREAAFAFIEELGVPANRLILGGFSQGAMLTVHLTLALPKPPAGLLLFSGNLLDRRTVAELAPARAGLRFFQSHGRQDPILSFKKAREQYDLLLECGWQGEFHEFDGEHEIPRGALQGAESLLKAIGAGA